MAPLIPSVELFQVAFDMVPASISIVAVPLATALIPKVVSLELLSYYAEVIGYI